MPIRIQRKRTKGWHMPANTIYVGRPSRYGNPYDWREYGREQAVQMYKYYLNTADRLIIAHELAGKNLACWCALDELCHADILLEIANS